MERALLVAGFSSPSWVQHLKLFQWLGSQGCLRGVWLEPLPLPSLPGMFPQPNLYIPTCQSIASLYQHAKPEGKCQCIAGNDALMHMEIWDLRIRTNDPYHLSYLYCQTTMAENLVLKVWGIHRHAWAWHLIHTVSIKGIITTPSILVLVLGNHIGGIMVWGIDIVFF